MLLLLLIFNQVYSNENDVILSSGVGGWTHEQLLNEFTTYKTYRNLNLISISSILTYYIEENGTLGVYNTGSNMWTSETFQEYIGSEIKIVTMPTLYCDATLKSSLCSNLSSRLNNLYENMDLFINDTIVRAQKYRWYGYIVDLEPGPGDIIDSQNVTEFILKWARALEKYNLILSVWIGSTTPYNMSLLYNSTIVQLITMNTYNLNFDQIINVLAPIQIQMMNVNKLGFGMLTNYNSNNTNIFDIINWSLVSHVSPISLWASHIEPEWYEALSYYLTV